MKKLFIIILLSFFFFFEGKTQSCSDGILNQDETSIDCGGVCGFPSNRLKINATPILTDSTCLTNQTTNCGSFGFQTSCIPDSTVGVFYKIQRMGAGSNSMEIILKNTTFGDSVYLMLFDSANTLIRYTSCLDSVVHFNNLKNTTTYYLFVSNKKGQTGSFDICIKEILAPPGIGPNGLYQDCNVGIPVCNNIYYSESAYVGFGEVEEVFNSCLASGERNSVWYIVTAQEDGPFGFEITSQPAVDYDFALYDITSTGCVGVPNSSPIRCNYCGEKDTTGLNVHNTSPKLPQMSESAAPGCNSMMNGIDAKAGDTYALIISNYTADNTGYKLEFFGTSYDTTKPVIDTAYIRRKDGNLIVQLNELIYCASISSSDFDLFSLDSNRLYNSYITGATGEGCTGQVGQHTQKIILELNAILPDSNYKLSLKNSIILQDVCGNIADTSSVVYFKTVTPCKPFSVSVDTVQEISCFGKNDAILKALVTGLDTVFQYSINGYTFKYDSVFTNLPQGNYTIYVKYDSECWAKSKITTVSTPTPLNISNLIQSNPFCHGDSTGTVQFNISGATSPYFIDWNGLDSSNLPKGNYSVIVKDYNNCSKTVPFSISEPLELKITATNSKADISGNQGQITCSAVGGTTPIQFSLDMLPYQSFSVFDGLATGFYIAYAKDKNGCIDSTKVFVDLTQGISSELKNIVQIYPNPSNGTVFIEAKEGGVSISIYNELSQIVIEKRKIHTKETINLGSGVYFIKIESTKGIYFYKMIVNN